MDRALLIPDVRRLLVRTYAAAALTAPSFTDSQIRAALFADTPATRKPAARLAGRAIGVERPAKTGDVALAGPDGVKVAALLANAQAEGQRVLADVTGSALKRFLRKPGAKSAHLFDDAERRRLADVLAAISGTADLLARVRIREREARALGSKGLHRHGDAQPFQVFAAQPVALLPPEEALRYFRGLTPTLGVNPDTFGPLQRRKAFTLSAAIDDVLVKNVHETLAQGLAKGTNATPDLQDLLDAAGVSAKNPQYAEMVVRTNAMDSYTTAVQDEMQSMPDTFPAWKYLGIADGRQRHAHWIHFNKYFPNSANFGDVRDSERGEFDGYNCRCQPSPIDRFEWAALRGRGARVESTW